MKPKSSLRHFIALVGSSLLAISFASAQTNLTWDTAPGTVGTGDNTITTAAGTWNTTNGNWTSDGGVNNVSWTNGSNAIFTTGVTLNIPDPITVNTITLLGGSGTLSSASTNAEITVNGGITFNDRPLSWASSIKLGGNQTWTIGGTNSTARTISGGTNLNGNELTWNSTISNNGAPTHSNITGNGSIVKDGVGTVTLGGTNTYMGSTTVKDGLLRMNSATALGSVNNQLTVNGGTLDMASFSLTVGNLTGTGGVITGSSGTRSLTIGSGNAGGGNFQGVIQNGTGGTTALTKIGTGAITLSGANTFTGVTTVTSGILSLNNSLALQNSAFDTTSSTTGTSTSGLKITTDTLTLGGLIGNKDFNTIFETNSDGGPGGTTATGGYGGITALTLNPQSGSVTYTANIADATTGMTLTKNGNGTQVLAGTNSYTGATTVNSGILNTTKALALAGYNSSGKVIFNGGIVGVQVGGTGWSTGQVDALLTNATKTSGALGIDTTNGDVTQWANLTEANRGALGIAKLGTNNLTLNQTGTYTGGLSVYNGNVVLDNITLTTSSLSFYTGATSQAITGGTLSMSGGSITRTNKTVGIVDTITSSITGSPTVSFATSTATDYRGGLQFAPSGNATQALGTITLSPINGGSDKAGLMIGGVSTGNSVASVTNSSAAYGTFRKRGPGEWTVGSINFGTFQNYAGTTIAQGLINGTYVGTQVFGGTLVLDYTNADTNRLGDAYILYLLGGTLQLDRSTGATGTHSEVVVSTTLSGSAVNINRSSGSSATLRMNVITRSAGATINLGAANIASTDTTNTNGILGSWATVGGADWAYNSGSTTVGGADASQPAGAADGFIRAYSGYTNVNRLTPGTIADGATTNVRLVEGSGSAGNIALGASTTTINTLNQSASGGTGVATIDTASKTLAVNGILVGAGSGGLTIGTSVGSGTLMAGAAGGELILHNYSSNAMTVNSVIANNTSASRLTITGTGTTILAGTNTYSGITKISGGVLEAAIGTGLSANTYLQLDGGVLQSSGSFIRTNSVTAGGSNFQWSGENGGGFAAKGGKLTVTIGNNAATEQTWAWVTDSANTTLATGNNAILGPLKFGSSTADSEVEFRNNINLNGETREIQVTDNTGSSGDFATLSGVIRNSSTVVPAGLYKSGSGTLKLTNANTYTGATTVSAGTLLVNNTTGSGTGSGLVTVGTSGTLGGSGTIAGATTVNGNLNPGNSPGVLSFTTSLALANTTTTNMEIDGTIRGTGYDGVNVGTTMALDGNLVLDIGMIFTSNATFNLFNVTGSTTGDFDNVSLQGAMGTGSFTFAASDVWSRSDGNNTWTFTESTGILSLAVIPEPSVALLSALGVMLLFRRRR